MEIIGNKKAVKLLDRIVATGRVAGAYLFVGPESVGKFTLAMKFAAELTSVGGKINPDLVVIEPEIEVSKGVAKKLSIKIEDIRELERKLGLVATMNSYRVAIINEAERMNRSAQNAILKTLEEPNEKVVIILVSSKEDKLLPTIISRCQKIRFGLVPEKTIKDGFPEIEENQDAFFWSLGRPGMAKKLMGDRTELEHRQESVSELQALLHKDVAKKFLLAEAWSKDSSEIEKKLGLWIVILRQAVLGRSGIGISRAKAFRLIENVSESLSSLRETNTNAKLVLENLFLKL
mgnify:CR=1 FL=1